MCTFIAVVSFISYFNMKFIPLHSHPFKSEYCTTLYCTFAIFKIFHYTVFLCIPRSRAKEKFKFSRNVQDNMRALKGLFVFKKEEKYFRYFDNIKVPFLVLFCIPPVFHKFCSFKNREFYLIFQRPKDAIMCEI